MLRGYFCCCENALGAVRSRAKYEIKNRSSAKEAAAQMHNGLFIKAYFIRLQTASA